MPWPIGCAGWTAAPTITWSSLSRCTSCWPACAPSCGATPPHKSGVLTVGDLCADPATHHVERAGQRLTLTAREFSLLEYFLRHPNQVLTRAQIEQHLWNYDLIAPSNVVDVAVRRLRRKIDDPFEVKLLDTLYGLGYRLRRPEGAP